MVLCSPPQRGPGQAGSPTYKRWFRNLDSSGCRRAGGRLAGMAFLSFAFLAGTMGGGQRQRIGARRVSEPVQGAIHESPHQPGARWINRVGNTVWIQPDRLTGSCTMLVLNWLKAERCRSVGTAFLVERGPDLAESC